MKVRASVGFMAALSAALCAGAAFGQAINETEPNSQKSAANPAVFTTAGDGEIGTITGNTTSFLTGTTGAANSADYFLVTLPSAPPGIYRYQFVVTSTTAGHSANFRGFSQSSGVISTASDQTVQTTTTTTTPPRMNAVYAFGSAAQVYYRVTGATSTTSDYTSTLTRSTVTPTVIADEFKPGDITISTLFQTNLDTAFIVLDSNFQPVTAMDPATMTPMAFRNDNENVPTLSGGTAQSSCTRTLAAGTYYIAVTDMGPSQSSFGNNEGAPADDRWRNLSVLEHPGTLFSASVQQNTNVSVMIGDGCRIRQVPLVKPAQYDIMFVRFTVGNPDIPCVTLSASASPATQGQVVDFYANVTPATGGATEITSVVADLSAFGGGSAVVMLNDGMTNGDAAVDGIWTARQTILSYRAGRATWRATATDADARSTTNQAIITMSTVPPPNDTCATAVTVSSLPYEGVFGNFQATTDADVSCNTGTAGTIQGIWWTYTPGTSSTLVLSELSAQDVIHVVYDATGGCDALGTPVLCTNTDEGAVVGVNSGTPYAILSARFASSATTISTDNYSVRFESQSIPAPVNDTCAAATIITTLPFTELVSNAGAGDDLDVSCNDVQYPLTRNGIWYTYTPASTCYLTFAETTPQDVVFSFMSGTCGELTEVRCNGIETGAQVLLQGGVQYFILVGRYSTAIAAGAAEQIGVSLSVCTALPAAPANDQCANATAITTLPLSENLAIAGATSDPIAPSCHTGATESGYGVWYSYTPGASATLELKEIGPENVYISVWTGACGGLTEVACFGDDVGTLNQFPVASGTTYFILISNAGVPASATVTYEVRFRVLPNTANNDCPGTPLALGTQVSGTTADATSGSISTGCTTSVKDLWWSFTAPFEDSFTFSCEKLGGGRAALEVFSACDGLSLIGCVNGVNGLTPHTVQLPQSIAAGQTVYIRLTSYLDVDGNFNLSVTASSPHGACCTGAACAITLAATCPGSDYQGNNSVCSPTTCVPAQEFCCRGVTCNSVAAGTCTGAFAGSASLVVGACGSGTALATCCHADFNHDGVPSIDDLFLYFNAYFTSSPVANVGGDGVISPTIDDLFLYINAYFAGCQ